MWKADHYFVHPSHSQTPCTTYAHYLRPSHYHYILSPAHNEFQQVELFLPIKNEWQNTLILSTLPVQLPVENTACLFTSSEVLTYSCVVLNTYTNWTYACQLSVETLSAEIEYGTLLLELPSFLTFHNTWEDYVWKTEGIKKKQGSRLALI